MKKFRISLSTPHLSENQRELSYIQKAFNDNYVAPLGPNLDEFEKQLSNLLGIKYCVALNSGTSSLHLSLKALGVNKGDFVAVSNFTFSAPVNAIYYLGAKPLFIDSEYDSWNMNPKLLEEAIRKFGSKIKAVLLVHSYGFSSDVLEILNICRTHNIKLVEDTAEALGSYFNNKHLGSFGDICALSFNGNKIITTSSGGAVLSNNKILIDKIRFWSQQSRENTRFYLHKEIGFNYRMSNVLAAIGLGQLEILSNRVGKKKEIYNYYKSNLGYKIKFHPIHKRMEPNYWLTCVLFETSKIRDKVYEILDTNHIECRHMWNPMHLQPVFKNDVSFLNGVSEDLFYRGLCLPSDTKMTKLDQDEIISLIQTVI